MGSLGIIANPMSGRDSRRLTARAESVSHESKRNQISRIVVGAVAAGCTRILAPYDPRRLVLGALENMNIGAEVEEIRNPITHSAEDTRQAVREMKARGCDVIIVMGGDGTSRIVTQVWQDVVMMPLSTGTNNVFPMWIEPTIAGMAAGLVASGRLSKEATTDRAKIITATFANGEQDIALVDALFLQGDRIGNLGPFEPEFMKTLVLTRAEPDAVGMSPLGGLLCPASASDNFGVRVDFCGHDDGGHLLRAPVSPGLFRSAHILSAERLPLAEATVIHGPGIVAYDGDRERKLAEGESASLTVARNGPWVINPQRTLQLAAEKQLMADLPPWVDPFDGAIAGECCGCANSLAHLIEPD